MAIQSDKKTYVSIIGVFPPEKLKSKELKLFPMSTRSAAPAEAIGLLKSSSVWMPRNRIRP